MMHRSTQRTCLVTFVTFVAEGAEPAPILVSGATLARFSGGLIAEEHVYYDTATLMAQTGAAAVPHAAATE